VHAGNPMQGVDAGEFLVDTTIQYVAAPGYQQDPAVAFDGVNFLVVWTDWRSDSSSGIYATRVSPQGVVLDPSGIAVSTAGSDQQYPAVAFDGTNFLAVWVDNRDSGYDVFAARVTPQGTVLDPTGIAVSTASGTQSSPAVAFDGVNSLVTWSDRRSDPSGDIYAARVTPQGTVLDPTGIAVSTGSGAQSSPTVAFDGVNSLVTWSDPRSDPAGDIYAARVTPQGTVLDPSGIVVSAAANTQESPQVAFDGTSFLVAWFDTRSTNYADVYAARVTPQGTVLDPSGIAVSTAEGYQDAEGVAFDGTNFWVTWSDYRSGSAYGDIYAARVTPQGTVLDTSGIPVATAGGDQYNSAVALGGANLLVTWEDYRSNPYEPDVYVARVTPAGTVLDPRGILATLAIGWQEYPAVAFDGANFLVSWANGRSDSTRAVYAARVTPQGAVLDSTDIAISTDPGWHSDPAIAFDGTNYLVTWMDYRNGAYGDIYATRVTPQGTVLDPSGIPVSTETDDQLYPAIAFDGTNYLVTWMDDRSGSTYDIYAARVTPQGTVLDPSGILVSAAADYQSYPAVAFGGTNYLVTWMDYRGGSDYDIYAARVTPQGVVLDSAGIAVSADTNDQLYPAVAFDGANFLVSWTDDRSDWQGDIYAARVTPAGAVLDPAGIAVSTVEGEQQYPDVAFDGTNCLVAWGDNRSGSTFDIYCARVTPAGVVFDSGPVVRQERDQVGPALARGSANQLFLAYEGWAGTVGGKTYNTDRIWGKMNPSPGVEEIENSEVRRVKGRATVLRGVLLWEASGIRHMAYGADLLDISGRKVMDLRSGGNDVRALAPGVYFISERSAVGGQRLATKVVITR
jgi:phosphoribosylformylglycinamidine (FGAM) synthase PurS component